MKNYIYPFLKPLAVLIGLSVPVSAHAAKIDFYRYNSFDGTDTSQPGVYIGAIEHGYKIEVEDGDCLSMIAQRISRESGNHVRWEELYDENRDIIGGNPSLIKRGMKLKHVTYTSNTGIDCI